MIKVLKKEHTYNYISNVLTQDYICNEYKNNPYANFIIYIIDNKVLGYIYYSDIYERAEINMFEVDKEERNRKIGNELLKYFLEKVNKPVTLEVKRSNEIAIHLYLKYGFEKVAIRKGYYNGEDGILMQYALKKERS